MVDRLCAMSDLPKPRVAVIPTDIPNAFATGRSPKHSAVAVTQGSGTGSSRARSRAPPTSSSHIGNRDVAVMTIASFFSMLAAFLMRMGMWTGMMGGGRNRDSGGAPAFLIMIVVSLVTYVLSYLLILMISRYREYAADRGAALITGAPENLMSALQKIASDMTRIPQRDLRQVEGMNAFFIIPTNVKRTAAELFMTHPPLEKRLARLAEISPRWAARSRPERLGPGRRPLRAQEAQRAKLDRLFALSTAQVTPEVELGLRPAGAAGVVFKPLSAGEFMRAEQQIDELLGVVAQTSGSEVRRRQDSLGYQWLVVRDRDFEDLVTGVHLVAGELSAHGFGEQLLAAIFAFEGRDRERPMYLIYGFKRGAFWPFVPTGEGQERDNAEELRLKNELQGERLRRTSTRWLGLFDAPLD